MTEESHPIPPATEPAAAENATLVVPDEPPTAPATPEAMATHPPPSLPADLPETLAARVAELEGRLKSAYDAAADLHLKVDDLEARVAEEQKTNAELAEMVADLRHQLSQAGLPAEAPTPPAPSPPAVVHDEADPWGLEKHKANVEELKPEQPDAAPEVLELAD